MTTIREALLRGTQRLRGESEHAQGSERLDAQILLGHVLDEPRTTLYAYPERELSAEDEERFMALIERRVRHEPVAYLVGQKEFYGREFFVDARVLIPRPETELLIETALTEIRSRLDAGQTPLVADIGAGSGIIPITLALEEPRLPLLYACDISPEALEVALINCQRHGVEERVTLRQGDLLQALPHPVDILVANLPYVGTDELPQMAPDVSEYEPHLALFSGPEGLGLLTRLCYQMSERAMLKPGGLCVLEIGYLQQEPLTNLLRTLWAQATITCIRDYAGWDRLLCIRLS
ncbi:peptide chain release factor N(5)-glutamine methyltransferase [Ktedonospora formicarum]|uniref:Release factor glutamine methyltransferase n=1 Tax=Ktedonospora formicarum TaxID=2778364 RepID=A0A8J3HXB2_9CHLR|nr:peptide chain release factor N(5)-glutamine methyltransferase [Ktedonospora formicarum]GHO44946.1 release factor glutamine methyltransferase [Ktedonospora formicarum]